MAEIDHLNDGKSKIHALQMMEKVTKNIKKAHAHSWRRRNDIELS